MPGSPPSSRGGTLQTAAVHVTAAEIIAIGDGTPKVLVDAPGSNTVIVPHVIIATFRAGTVVYDKDPVPFVSWSSFQTFNYPVTTGTTMTGTANETSFTPLGLVGFFTDSGAAGSPQGEALVVAIPAPNPFSPPLGNGTFDLTVYYTAASLVAA